MKDSLRESALDYHKNPKPGKIAITPTKAMATAKDLALAYSPGVAAPCEEIAADPLKALDYTSRGNMVAVITNGTAVLGLGAIGALASKPVMEGKSVLFKKFANLDSVDIEIDELDVDAFVDTVARVPFVRMNELTRMYIFSTWYLLVILLLLIGEPSPWPIMRRHVSHFYCASIGDQNLHKFDVHFCPV